MGGGRRIGRWSPFCAWENGLSMMIWRHSDDAGQGNLRSGLSGGGHRGAGLVETWRDGAKDRGE